jgi:hypothetical protein
MRELYSNFCGLAVTDAEAQAVGYPNAAAYNAAEQAAIEAAKASVDNPSTQAYVAAASNPNSDPAQVAYLAQTATNDTNNQIVAAVQKASPAASPSILSQLFTALTVKRPVTNPAMATTVMRIPPKSSSSITKYMPYLLVGGVAVAALFMMGSGSKRK